ncbi:MAG: CaiB/BaiF CoA-transferase family protein [Halobacteriota archaeon]|nr:CaiB/BaiF CoA-transferase family protein [Halobacteriota archaeon]
MTLPIEDVKILDLSRLLPGPYCSMLLSDLGADVLVVEIPGRAATPPYLQRNKRSMTLNLKSEGSKEIFYKLVEGSDVILEGFRPGVTKKLGVDYDTVRKINPRAIYCSISGFGQDGPYVNKPGHDINYIGYSGILNIPGKVPNVPGTTVADLGSSMFAVISILAALLAREKTGEGQYIDVSMLDSVVSWMGTYAGGALAQGSISTYDIYEVKDGYITLGALEEKFRRNFWKVLEGLVDSDMKKKVKQKDVFSEILKTKTLNEWLKILDDADVPCGPVYTSDEALADPQVVHRGMVVEIDTPTGKIKHVPFPVKFSDTPVQKIRSPPPPIGKDTEEVLKELGYSEDKIKEFKRAKVV